jgi:hypothetical protein
MLGKRHIFVAITFLLTKKQNDYEKGKQHKAKADTGEDYCGEADDE